MPEEIAFADLHSRIGDDFVSDWVLIDQDRVNAFATVTDDHNWVHVDIERSNAFRGTTIAHGFLVLTLLPGLMYKLIKVTGVAHALNYGLEQVRFTGIVNTGTRVRLRIAVADIRPKAKGPC